MLHSRLKICLLFKGPRSVSKLRSIYYPPIKKAIEEKIALEKSQIVRCGEHSDYGTITFLYQDDMGGLEVRAVDNSWIKVTFSRMNSSILPQNYNFAVASYHLKFIVNFLKFSGP